MREEGSAIPLDRMCQTRRDEEQPSSERRHALAQVQGSGSIRSLAKSDRQCEKSEGASLSVRDQLMTALAMRSYHLPNYNWYQDWIQYTSNNHPICGIFLHHKFHPIGVRMRLLFLFGSVAFGLLITNWIWLWFIYEHDDEPFLVIDLDTFNINRTKVNNDYLTDSEISISQEMALLWTIGGCLHATFDLSIWYLTACVCCLPGQPLERCSDFRWLGSYSAIATIVICTAVASFIVILRATLDSDESDITIQELESGGLVDDSIEFGRVDDASAYEFLLGYGVELILALFLYWPLLALIFFTGVLGCGKVPLLGGRPYEVEQERRAKQLEVDSVSDIGMRSMTNDSGEETDKTEERRKPTIRERIVDLSDNSTDPRGVEVIVRMDSR